jgi:hypothetical protein
MFLPLVNVISKILKRMIKDNKQGVELAIKKIFNVEGLTPTVPQMAVKQDMLLLFWNAIKYNLNIWNFSPISINS